MGPSGCVDLPVFAMPPMVKNHGNYIVSMGNVCRWHGTEAEALGVEIYPGMPASKLVFRPDGSVKGVVVGEVGIGKDGQPTDQYQPGMELCGKYVLFAEGARGSLSKQLIEKFELQKGRDPQKYGIGLKELWEIRPEKSRPGHIQHTFGWPLRWRM